jgi:hypothetical protein
MANPDHRLATFSLLAGDDNRHVVFLHRAPLQRLLDHAGTDALDGALDVAGGRDPRLGRAIRDALLERPRQLLEVGLRGRSTSACSRRSSISFATWTRTPISSR